MLWIHSCQGYTLLFFIWLKTHSGTTNPYLTFFYTCWRWGRALFTQVRLQGDTHHIRLKYTIFKAMNTSFLVPWLQVLCYMTLRKSCSSLVSSSSESMMLLLQCLMRHKWDLSLWHAVGFMNCQSGLVSSSLHRRESMNFLFCIAFKRVTYLKYILKMLSSLIYRY